MNDEADILRCICLNPDDDAPRLALADRYDEMSDNIDCPTCSGNGYHYVPWSGDIARRPVMVHVTKSMIDPKSGAIVAPADCLSCHGKGVVSNGYAERAEFIRLMMTYSELDVKYNPFAPLSVKENADRMNHLWHEFGHLWGCAKELGVTDPSMYGFAGTKTGVTWFFRRGLVDQVELPLAEFMAHAQTIALTHPVRKWVLTDAEPLTGDSMSFCWFPHPHRVSPYFMTWELPLVLYSRLTCRAIRDAFGGIRYSSKDDANADLQQACYHYARIPLLASIATAAA